MPTISELTVDVSTRTSKFSSGLKVVTAGLGVLAAGAAFAFKQFEDAEKIQNQTAAVLESTGHAARISGKDISDMAQRLASLTGVDDEAIQAGENLLLTFTNIKNKVGGEFTGTFDRATGAVLDMSVAMGQDMKSSAIQIGKALNDPVAGITALTRVGVKFDEQTKKQIETLVKHGEVTKAQAIILDELTTEFGGSAEAQATASGKMSVALGNLAETVGGVVAPAFTFLAEKLQLLAEFLQTNVGPAFRAAREWFMGLWDSLTSGAGVIGGIVEWFQKVWDVVKPVAETVGRELVEAFQQTWRVLQSNLGPMLAALWSLLQKLWDVFKPLVIVIGVGLYLAFRLIAEVLPIVIVIITKLIEWLAKIIEGALDVVSFIRDKFGEPIVNTMARIIDWIGKVVGWVKDRLVAAWDFAVAPIIRFIQMIIDKVETLVGWLIKAVEWLGRLNPFGGASGTPEPFRNLPLPEFSHGGVMPHTGLAMVHQGETIVPAGGGMGGLTVINNGTMLGTTPTQLAVLIRDEFLKLKARNATTGL